MFKCCHASKPIVKSLPNYCCCDQDTFSASDFSSVFLSPISVLWIECSQHSLLCYQLLASSTSLSENGLIGRQVLIIISVTCLCLCS